jgi:hypothetical protein
MTFSWVSRGVSVAGFAIVLAMPVAASAATVNGTQMIKNWAVSDRCVAAANRQFPDYTADSLAKRDQAVQQCLSNNVLAPRAPLSSQPDAQQ